MRDPEVALVLASASPRRRELLARLGIDFAVVSPDVDETPRPGEPPDRHVTRIAQAKALAGADRHPEAVVLAADTAVVLGSRIFGKPASDAEAATMLGELAGKTHEVLTAAVLRWRGREALHLEIAKVRLVPFAPDLYAWYVATGEPGDKAGAYAVQGRGALLVERVEGNVQAVVGLPLAPLPALFRQVGLHLAGRGGRLSLSSPA